MRLLLRKISNKALTFVNHYQLLRNIYSSAFNRKVLISYITTPLSKGGGVKIHTNNHELLAIVEILHSLKYSIDVIDYDIKLKLDFSKYDLIFGFGETFEESFNDSSFRGKRVYYATGAHVYWQNSEEIKRIIEFNKRNKSNLVPKRIVPWNWSMSTAMSDAIIVIGNSWTVSTYKDNCNIPIYAINATGAFYKFDILPQRNIEEARKSFLWFGSSGLIHKGLDICIDFFSKKEEFHLHICGPKENDFFKLYENELNLNNIHYHGFVNTDSDLFQQIVSKCLFSIMPSCSEGQSTALLTTMGTGLIPIATMQTGIDITSYGFLLDDISECAISKTIGKINRISDKELLKMSSSIFKEIHQKHSLIAFKESFKLLIKNIIWL